jgi:hypothetical protein
MGDRLVDQIPETLRRKVREIVEEYSKQRGLDMSRKALTLRNEQMLAAIDEGMRELQGAQDDRYVGAYADD